MLRHARTAGSKSIGAKFHDSPAAVLIGLDSMQGLQAARVLASRGVRVIAIARSRNHDACRTNVCQRILFTDTRSEVLIDALAALGKSLSQKAVLFPCEDANVLLISRHRERLEEWFHIALPDAGVVEMLMDKVQFYAYALENDFPIPRTMFVRSRKDLEAASRALTFPCILKPANSATRQWESSVMVSAFKVPDANEMRSLYERYHPYTDVFIVQEWISGPDSNLYSCNCYFDKEGNPVVTFVAKKLRQWPPHVGKSSLGIECESEAVLRESLSLLRRVGYRGLGYVEFKYDERTGTYFIVEPNVGRPTGRSSIAEAGGVELLYTMYCDMLDLPLPPNREQKYLDTKWIHLRKDFQSALHYWRTGDLTLREWWRSWRGRKAFALFSLRDPKPFLSDLWRVARVLLSASERRGRLNQG